MRITVEYTTMWRAEMKTPVTIDLPEGMVPEGVDLEDIEALTELLQNDVGAWDIALRDEHFNAVHISRLLERVVTDFKVTKVERDT